jgi:hypothetical protein
MKHNYLKRRLNKEDETGVPPPGFIIELARLYPEKPIYVTFSGDKKHMEASKAFLEPRECLPFR